MINILANDGIHPDGKLLLEEADYAVNTQKIPQEKLASAIEPYHVLIVRSATKVTRDIIDAGKNLKIIARGGVGLDNVDVAYAKEKGIAVFNTPKASSRAVAELAFAHLVSLSRGLQRGNREMYSGDFKLLKRDLEKGRQIAGRTLGIIGFGRIGQELAKIALGIGMKVVAHDPFVEGAEIGIRIHAFPDLKLCVQLHTTVLQEVIQTADFISLHIPGGDKPVIGTPEMQLMKTGACLINTARGGVIDETALLEFLNNGKLGGAGLDVFVDEPYPRKELLQHPLVSCTPHIGAATIEAQSLIGLELADMILAFFGDDK
jgi:D-3-phosphoglycerate dehydrogenase